MNMCDSTDYKQYTTNSGRSPEMDSHMQMIREEAARRRQSASPIPQENGDVYVMITPPSPTVNNASYPVMGTTNQQSALQQPTMQQPTMQQPTMQQPALQQPALQQPTMQQPTIQQPTMQQPANPDPNNTPHPSIPLQNNLNNNPNVQHTRSSSPLIPIQCGSCKPQDYSCGWGIFFLVLFLLILAILLYLIFSGRFKQQSYQ
jgi:hypothetical protein